MILADFGVIAALVHLIPRNVFGTRGMGLPMNLFSRCCQFAVEAAAGLGRAISKRTPVYLHRGSAVAAAFPVPISGICQNDPAAKALSNQIDSSHMTKSIKNRAKREKNTMKTTFKFATLALALLALAAALPAQQNYLGQTTLSAVVNGQYLGPGPTGNVPAPTLIQVASSTGMYGLNPNLGITASQPNQTYLYIDREQMKVTAVNGTALTVVRGVNGTSATPHASGAMVLFGPQRFFYTFDPGGTPTVQSLISNVPCVLNNVIVSPWVNIRSGFQWVCNPSTLVWTPGFNTPGQNTGGSFATVASVAGTTQINGPVFKVSGANAITAWGLTTNAATSNVGLNTGASSSGGQFCIIPTGAFTTTATNNIGSASTAVVGQIQCWVWNGTDSKFYLIP
jgi:hypothetical protein